MNIVLLLIALGGPALFYWLLKEIKPGRLGLDMARGILAAVSVLEVAFLLVIAASRPFWLFFTAVIAAALAVWFSRKRFAAHKLAIQLMVDLGSLGSTTVRTAGEVKQIFVAIATAYPKTPVRVFKGSPQAWHRIYMGDLHVGNFSLDSLTIDQLFVQLVGDHPPAASSRPVSNPDWVGFVQADGQIHLITGYLET